MYALSPVTEATAALEAATIKIQRRFRMRRARYGFVRLAKQAYERGYDVHSKQYFYYNNHTRLNQRNSPALLKEVQSGHNQHRYRQTHNNESSPEALGAAATRIQSLYRRRPAKVALQKLMQVYERVYDDDSKSYYYYNKRTKMRSWEQPKFLNCEDAFSFTTLDNDPERVMAAIKIQKLYRRRVTQSFVRDLARGNIERHFDSSTEAWFYYNLRTQQTFWEQPHHSSLRHRLVSLAHEIGHFRMKKQALSLAFHRQLFTLCQELSTVLRLPEIARESTIQDFPG